MTNPIPDQAERLRQLVAEEEASLTNKPTAVLDTPETKTESVSDAIVVEKNSAKKTDAPSDVAPTSEPSAKATQAEEKSVAVTNQSTATLDVPAKSKPQHNKETMPVAENPASERSINEADELKTQPTQSETKKETKPSEKQAPNTSAKPIQDEALEQHKKSKKKTEKKPGKKPVRKIVTPVPTITVPDSISALLSGKRFPVNKATRVIAVTGGKGGVGKSNVACNMAIAMAQINKRVLLMDADLSLANLDVLIGLTPRHNLGHVIAGEKRLQDITLSGPNGISIIPGGSGLEELTQLDQLEMGRLFDAFAGINPAPDVLIVDTAAGIHPNVMQFLMAADQVIIVTTPEPTAYTDAYALIKTILKHDSKKEFGMLINMANDSREATEVLRLMLHMCRQFLDISFNNLGYVPRDPAVLKAVRHQTPFILGDPKCPAAKAIRNLTASILQVDTKDLERTGLKRFFHRLFSHQEKANTKQAAV